MSASLFSSGNPSGRPNGLTAPHARLQGLRRYWAIDPDAVSVAAWGTSGWTGLGFAYGVVYGVVKSTGPGTSGIEVGINATLAGGAFFAIRELLVSPALLYAPQTNDHKRRALRHWDRSAFDQLPPESWTDIRYRRVLDSAGAGGITGLVLPRLYNTLLRLAAYPTNPVPSPWQLAVTFAFSSSLAALTQLGLNTFKVHDLKMYGAWDAHGPMPHVDVFLAREAQERRRLARADQGLPAATPAEEQDELEGARTRKKPWWSLRRFMFENMPRMEVFEDEDWLARLEEKRAKLRKELAEVRSALRDMGEVPENLLEDE